MTPTTIKSNAFHSEFQRIIKVADLNGYSDKEIKSIINKHKKLKNKADTTSLWPLRIEKCRVAIESIYTHFQQIKVYFQKV